MNKTINYYNQHADLFFQQYHSVTAEKVHGDWVHLIHKEGLALDIGSGSGRDSSWLAKKGYDVIAVEPSKNMREKSLSNIEKSNIIWMDDTLPDLKNVYNLNIKFDLILLSAVWMHVPAGQRERAFRKIANLLNPGGKIVITLRFGSNCKDEREFFNVSLSEVKSYARNHALSIILHKKETDALYRENISWETVVFESPDDGTGAFPLIRSIIVNDAKSSTYKLALLRVILKIAEICPFVAKKYERHVSLPLGLVSLFWIRQYHQLLSSKNNIQQMSNSNLNLGFIKKDGFKKLNNMITEDLALSHSFTGDEAKALYKTLKHVSTVIKNMPVKYITYPASDKQIFSVVKKEVKQENNLILSLDKLKDFGEFKVPKHLWDSMTQYAVWIEPAILHEWITVMQGYVRNKENNYDYGTYMRFLQWLDPLRKTNQIRKIVDQLQAKGKPVYCVWTGARLKNDYEIDHCFPFSRWQNNDLWNMLPSSKKANGRKSDKLPTLELLDKSKEKIISWWIDAYIDNPIYRNEYFQQIECGLPIGLEKNNTDEVYIGLKNQRVRIKQILQLEDWNG